MSRGLSPNSQNASSLPQAVYVKGFLRSYFRYLSVPDAEKLVSAFSARLSDWQANRKAYSDGFEKSGYPDEREQLRLAAASAQAAKVSEQLLEAVEGKRKSDHDAHKGEQMGL